MPAAISAEPDVIGAEEDCFDKVRHPYPACLPGRSFLGNRDLRRALRGFDGLVETAILGISGGQGPKENGAFPAGKPIGFLCQFECFGAVAQRPIRTSR